MPDGFYVWMVKLPFQKEDCVLIHNLPWKLLGHFLLQPNPQAANVEEGHALLFVNLCSFLQGQSGLRDVHHCNGSHITTLGDTTPPSLPNLGLGGRFLGHLSLEILQEVHLGLSLNELVQKIP